MNEPVRYRWIVLIGLAMWGFMAMSIAFGIARKSFTLQHSFVPVAMLFVATIPLSVTWFTKQKWFVPIATTWMSLAIVAIHFAGKRIMGFGSECDRVVLGASITAFCVLNGTWVVNKLWRRHEKAALLAF